MKKRIEFYTDQELDSENGLYNYDARLYDPIIAKFLSIDPKIKDIYDPQSINPYAYCRNNPLIYTDPDGEIFWFIIGAAVVYAILHDPPEVNAPGENDKLYNAPTAVETTVKTAVDVSTVVGAGGALKEGVKKGVTEITKEVISEETGIPTDLGDLKKLKNIKNLNPKKLISTGRTKPRNLKEKLAMEEVMSNPRGVTPPRMSKMSDTKNNLLAEDGWVKKTQNVNGVEIHYVENVNTGEVLDFKFKDN